MRTKNVNYVYWSHLYVHANRRGVTVIIGCFLFASMFSCCVSPSFFFSVPEEDQLGQNVVLFSRISLPLRSVTFTRARKVEHLLMRKL